MMGKICCCVLLFCGVGNCPLSFPRSKRYHKVFSEKSTAPSLCWTRHSGCFLHLDRPGYLDEFNWQKCYPGDHFNNLLADIAELWPPNYCKFT